ncbi:MAG: hypothetical protein PQJ49_01485 [Sphaerochaetaceae bacterium]|nr:hypothetical protein [Sphaerochaetaceae bacterium]
MMERMFLIEKAKQPKKYQLRWLFYRKSVSYRFGKNNYTASEICKLCRKGVSYYMTVLMFGGKSHSYCPHCSQNLEKVPNTNFNHKLWKFGKKLDGYLENFLNFTHILRKRGESRYGMFGDESKYILATEFSKDWDFVKEHKRKRKWWEYIIIEKR